MKKSKRALNGVYDNCNTMRRESYKDGKVIQFIDATILKIPIFRKCYPYVKKWGSLPNVKRIE